MATTPRPDDRRWLLLQLQLPGGRSTARVGLWRRLRKLGAVALGSTWALPDDAESRESFEWLRRDAVAAGGEALLFVGRAVDGEVESAVARRRGGEAAAAERRAGADPLAPLDPVRYRRRRWVTRPRPGVDRMASAWLVRRFVDSEAKFEFADDPLARGGRTVPFDAYGAELGHQLGLCTFEVLAARFGIDDAAVRRIGRLVHAVDLHEIEPDDAEAALVERLVAGLRASHAEDGELLAAGIALFEALYAAPPAEENVRRAQGATAGTRKAKRPKRRGAARKEAKR